MFNRSPKIDRNKPYVYFVSKEDLLASPHSVVGDTLEGAPAHAPYAPAKGLEEIRKESVRSGSGLLLGGKRPVSVGWFSRKEQSTVTEANLKRWFPGEHYNNLLTHFTQSPAQAVSKIVGHVAYSDPQHNFREVVLTQSARRNLDRLAQMPPKGAQGRLPTLTDFYVESDDIYCDTLTYIQPGIFPDGHSLKKAGGGIEVFSRFRLLKPNEKPRQENRYELIKVGTDCKEIRDMLRGDEEVLKESLHSIHSLAEEKIPQQEQFAESPKKPAPKPWNWKAIGVGVVLTLGVIGIAALVVGAILFPPSLAITAPFFGVLLHASPLALAGAGLLGATALGFVGQKVVTSERFKEKYAQIHPAWKWTAGIAIGLGVVAMVTAAVLFPPSLLIPVFYGGAALMGLTAVGHSLHTASKPVAEDNKSVADLRRSTEEEAPHPGLQPRRPASLTTTTTASVRRSMQREPGKEPVSVAAHSAAVNEVKKDAPAEKQPSTSFRGTVFDLKKTIELPSDTAPPSSAPKLKGPSLKSKSDK